MNVVDPKPSDMQSASPQPNDPTTRVRVVRVTIVPAVQSGVRAGNIIRMKGSG